MKQGRTPIPPFPAMISLWARMDEEERTGFKPGETSSRYLSSGA